MITRRFEYTGGGSDKFWEVTYPDANVDRGVRTWTTRWGRRGTTGQSKTFTEPAQHHAYLSATGKIQEKLNKGYTEIAIPGQWRPQVRQVETVPYTSPRMRQRRATAPTSNPSAIAEAAVRLAQSTNISVSEAMSLIERATQSQVNPANFPAALAAATKAAKPLPHASRTRKITLE